MSPASIIAKPSSVFLLPVFFLVVVLIWSTTPLAIHWSVQSYSLSFAVMLRMLMGLGLSGLLLVILRTPLPLHQKAWQTYLAGGISLFVSMILTYAAAQWVSSGFVSVLYGLSPLMTSAAAVFWLQEERSLSQLKLAGMLMGFIGLLLVFRSSLHSGKWALWGLGLLLLAVLSQAVGLVVMKRIGDQSAAVAVNCGVLLVASPLFVLSWWWLDGQIPSLVWNRSLMAIVYLSTFGSVLGFVLYLYLIQKLAASTVALITLVTPVLALILGQTLNHEHIHLSTWLGAGAIAAGLSLHQLDQRSAK